VRRQNGCERGRRNQSEEAGEVLGSRQKRTVGGGRRGLREEEEYVRVRRQKGQSEEEEKL
jgi:hypothetical protein